ncbi:MAG: phage head-tail joining protein [Cypionkella sp.]
MGWTQADLDALKEAYATGTLRVRLPDGREVTYPSGDDLLRRIRIVEADLASAPAGQPAPVGRFATFRRG